MNLHQLFLTENNCYKAGVKFNPTGIMVHSTGANNPNLKRYVGPDDGLLGKNQYDNHWNTPTPGGRSICVHGFIGKLADGTVATYQTLPWDMRGWHSGKGANGTANDTHIGFEICEDNLSDETYFKAVYTEAVELCAMLCKAYNIKPVKPNIISHAEGHELGIASNHGDPTYWFSKYGKSMDAFRADVQSASVTLPSAQNLSEGQETACPFKSASIVKDCPTYSKLNKKQLPLGEVYAGETVMYLGDYGGLAAIIYQTSASEKIAFVDKTNLKF